MFLISLAFAYESETQPVELEDYAELFTSAEYSTGILPGGSPVGIEFYIEANGGAAIAMDGEADLTWPDAVSLAFTGDEGSGYLALEGSLDAVAAVSVDLTDYGYDYSASFEIDRRTLEFDGNGFFDPFVFDDSASPQVQVVDSLDSTQLIYYEASLVTGVVELEVSVDVTPVITVTYESVQWTLNDSSTLSSEGTVVLPVDRVADFPVDAVLRGAWYSTFDIVFAGTLTLNTIVGNWDLLDVEAPINLTTDTFEQDFPTWEMDFPLPLLSPGISSGTFGEVLVGSLANLEVPLSNEGNLPVYGQIALEGSSDFSVYPDQFNANPGTTDGVVVTFAPSGEGEQTATLILYSNDPTIPTLEIPLSGSGFAPTVDTGGDPLGEVEDTGAKIDVQTCGCATSTSSNMGLLNMGLLNMGLLTMGLLLRRRA